jgi:prepilin-type N-terminal cleavage/methylation domain-containing protein
VNHSLKKNDGFSLIEILLVLMIMGLLASMVMPNLGAILQIAKTQTLKNIARTTQLGIETYLLVTGTYPTQSQDNLPFFTTLKTVNAIGNIPVNPYTSKPYQATSSNGKVQYHYNTTTQTYTLTLYGTKNKDVLIILSNQ